MPLAELPADVTSIGVGGIFAILVIREVLNFVRNRNNKPDQLEALRRELAAMSPVVFEIADRLKGLNGNIESVTQLLREIREEQRTVIREAQARETARATKS